MNIGFMACFEPEYFSNFQTFAFESEKSLLEFDLVLWHLEFLHYGYGINHDNYHDELKRLMTDRKRRIQEIDEFLQYGKSLYILISEPIPIHVEKPSKVVSTLREFWDDSEIGKKSYKTIAKGSQRQVRRTNANFKRK